ncbi:MAG: hypothetical protein J6C75_06405, partial [Oscillospiraceae bacterium]|nr:hypothetical protein [Oscillospiraceae bacterium]
MAKKLVARIAADNQSGSVEEHSSERCAWYVVAGRILMILAALIIPTVLLAMIMFMSLVAVIEIAPQCVNLSVIEYILKHPLAVTGVLYLVFLFLL